MKIIKIQIENYRLLKDFSMNLEDELSLVIGKNNTGKTSILSILDKFLNQSEKNKLSFDDFNIDFKTELKTLIEGDPITECEYRTKSRGIKLRLFIQYTENCNLENVSRIMMDLDPDNNNIVLGFEYTLPFHEYEKLKKDYNEFIIQEDTKKTDKPNYKPKSAFDFLHEKHRSYFQSYRKSIEVSNDGKIVNEANYIDLENEHISIEDIISFKYISARRDVADKEKDKTLSNQTSKIYAKTETNSDKTDIVNNFKDKLSETDNQLDSIYKELFEKIIGKVAKFGGIKPNESKIEIISNLQQQELLKGNTTVVYKHDDDNKLPEYYNGLGYMNLISMIFDIEILIQEFKREKGKKPADINLLFIEEPEAHTHPQMQYIFIKNIKNLLGEGIQKEDGTKRKIQYIISTHSSHIVADSDFDDIKYLKKEGNNVSAKNLKDLKKEYSEETKQYQFLTQYLTLSRAEIFFADKAVLIEGDTERLLIPAIMKKLDIEEESDDTMLPLLSQNISIVEVGAYSQIFDQFIDFLGIKTLVITDLDTTKKEMKDEKEVYIACPVAEGESYSNGAISHYFNKPTLENLKGYSFENKLFNKAGGKWDNQPNGKLCIVYQTNENGYNARSFEDAFIHLNRDFIKNSKDDFKGLQNIGDFDVQPEKGAYDLADHCIKKKTHFALDILFHSDEKLSNWQIPEYIKEGLLWLKQN